MKWKSTYKHPEGLVFYIEHEVFLNAINLKEAQAYYLIGENKEGTFCNYYQEHLDVAQEQALEDFGVPLDSWVRIPDDVEIY